jgi:hypothetical protein
MWGRLPTCDVGWGTKGLRGKAPASLSGFALTFDYDCSVTGGNSSAQ